MKFKLFGLEIEIKKKNQLSKMGAEAKKRQSLEKIKNALLRMKEENYKFSEYRLKKISGLSINTIKKYRKEIREIRNTIDY
jgi:hypothetical protein